MASRRPPLPPMRRVACRAAALLLGAALLTGVSAASAAPPSTETFRDRAPNVVREVLATPEFNRAAAAGESWRTWLRERIRDFFRWLGAWFEGLPDWLAWVIVSWMVLTLLAIFAHLVYVLVTQFGRGPPRDDTPEGRASRELFGVRARNFDEVYAAALREIQAGKWSLGVCYLYVATILWLDRAARIDFRQSKTNQDYVRELAALPEAQGRFRRMTTLFETTAYGRRTATQALCTEMTDNLEAIRHETGAGHPA